MRRERTVAGFEFAFTFTRRHRRERAVARLEFAFTFTMTRGHRTIAFFEIWSHMRRERTVAGFEFAFAFTRRHRAIATIVTKFFGSMFTMNSRTIIFRLIFAHFRARGFWTISFFRFWSGSLSKGKRTKHDGGRCTQCKSFEIHFLSPLYKSVMIFNLF